MIVKNKDVEVAYTAGVIDSDGYIGIYKQKAKDYKNGYVYVLRVGVGSTNLNILNWLKSHYGGSNCSYPHKNKKWKQLHRWQLGNQQAKKFLKAIYPYLIIKKEQAEISIEFQSRKRTFGPRERTMEELLFDELDYNKMRKLNKRGV